MCWTVVSEINNNKNASIVPNKTSRFFNFFRAKFLFQKWKQFEVNYITFLLFNSTRMSGWRRRVERYVILQALDPRWKKVSWANKLGIYVSYLMILMIILVIISLVPLRLNDWHLSRVKKDFTIYLIWFLRELCYKFQYKNNKVYIPRDKHTICSQQKETTQKIIRNVYTVYCLRVTITFYLCIVCSVQSVHSYTFAQPVFTTVSLCFLYIHTIHISANPILLCERMNTKHYLICWNIILPFNCKFVFHIRKLKQFKYTFFSFSKKSLDSIRFDSLVLLRILLCLFRFFISVEIRITPINSFRIG